MNIIYPINGKNERMGSLFSTPKHLLLYKQKSLLLNSIDNVSEKFKSANFIIITNENYYNQIKELFQNNSKVSIKLIGPTSSQIETIKKVTLELTGSVMFIDCDIVPIEITDFDVDYPTVFTFSNIHKLLNYSNFKCDKNNNILDCNEKLKLYKQAGTGIYYFPDVEKFNTLSENCKSVSECINAMLSSNIKSKLNTSSTVKRFGTLQDIYVDNFSFRNPKNKDLSTGFTNNKVYKNRKQVIKIGATTEIENMWYESYQNKMIIPKVLRCTNKELVMEFIKRDEDLNLDDILDLIHVYKKYPKLNDLNFSNYIDNIRNHLSKNKSISNGNILIDKLEQLNIKPTFSHGDLSVMNIIPTKLGLRLIDPLYSTTKFGSYELDIAKLCFSFKFYKNDAASFKYVKDKSAINYIDVLIAAESVRVASYKEEYNFISENLINELI
jgi:hypothetical protein